MVPSDSEFAQGGLVPTEPQYVLLAATGCEYVVTYEYVMRYYLNPPNKD